MQPGPLPDGRGSESGAEPGPEGAPVRSGWHRPFLVLLLAASCYAAGDLRVVDAIKRRDDKAVSTLVSQHADVNAAQPDGATALAWAAYLDDTAGADPNYTAPDGTKVLSVAAAYKSAAAAVALVDGGAEPNVADRGGNTPLHLAAQAGSLDLVKKLLAKGANANARTTKIPAGGRGGGGGGGFFRPAGEQTPLLMAAKAGHENVMRALVAGGADPSLKAQDGSTLLMAAAGSGHVEPVKYAWELDPHPAAVSETGATAMHAAVTGTGAISTQAEICKVAQFLADKGVPMDNKDARGRTPIDIADTLPLDTVVDLLTQLIIKSGAAPTKSKR